MDAQASAVCPTHRLRGCATPGARFRNRFAFARDLLYGNRRCRLHDIVARMPVIIVIADRWRYFHHCFSMFLLIHPASFSLQPCPSPRTEHGHPGSFCVCCTLYDCEAAGHWLQAPLQVRNFFQRRQSLRLCVAVAACTTTACISRLEVHGRTDIQQTPAFSWPQQRVRLSPSAPPPCAGTVASSVACDAPPGWGPAAKEAAKPSGGERIGHKAYSIVGGEDASCWMPSYRVHAVLRALSKRDTVR